MDEANAKLATVDIVLFVFFSDNERCVRQRHTYLIEDIEKTMIEYIGQNEKFFSCLCALCSVCDFVVLSVSRFLLLRCLFRNEMATGNNEKT